MTYAKMITEINKMRLSYEDAPMFHSPRERAMWEAKMDAVNDKIDEIIDYLRGLQFEDEPVINARNHAKYYWDEENDDE